MTPGLITGNGVCTPLGLTTASSEAAFRAALLPAAETAIRGGDGEPIRAVYLHLLPANHSRSERMLSLAELALDDLVQSTPRAAPGVTSAFIGLPELERGVFAALADSIVAMLRARIPTSFQAQFFCQGRSAVFFALEAALTALAAGTCDRVLVGAVESLCSPDVLRRLYRQRRLLGVVSDGIIPGEGAAFLLIERFRLNGEGSSVLCVSTAQEPRHFHQERPSSAKGLSSVLRGIRSHAPTRDWRADLMYTCETGERFWSEELSLAYLRNIAIMPEPFVRTMAGESFGDLGAASGGVMIAMGIRRLTRIALRSSASPSLLVCGSSDDGYVGACVIQGPAAGGGSY